MRTKPTNVILDPHTKRWLRSEAKRTKDSVSRVIRLAVAEYRRAVEKGGGK